MTQKKKPLDTGLEILAKSGSVDTLSHLSPQIVIEALNDARQKTFDEFRGNEQAWLQVNLAGLLSAIEISFAHAIKSKGPELADAVLMGSLLGGSIIRSTVESGAVSLETCRANVQAWDISVRGIEYDGLNPDNQFLEEMLGDELASAFGDIRNPASRTMCILITGAALSLPVTGI